MGYNTVLFICNDAMNEIKNHPEDFYNQLVTGMNRCGREPYDFGLGCHANGFQVVSSQHADLTTVIAAGGNHATVLGYTLGHSHHTDEAKVRLIKEVADQLGYNLVKKRKRKEQ